MDSGALTELGKLLVHSPWLLAAIIVGSHCFLVRTINRHEQKCAERWAKNWSLHETTNTRVSKLEGRAESE